MCIEVSTDGSWDSFVLVETAADAMRKALAIHDELKPLQAKRDALRTATSTAFDLWKAAHDEDWQATYTQELAKAHSALCAAAAEIHNEMMLGHDRWKAAWDRYTLLMTRERELDDAAQLARTVARNQRLKEYAATKAAVQ